MNDLDQFDNNDINFELLAEECSEIIKVCAEIIQTKSKIKRFGLNDENPNTNISNRNSLIQEIGDLLAIVDILENDGIFSSEQLFDAKINKLKKLKNWYTN